jgi:polyhydroxybutyrate depolymerase
LLAAIAPSAGAAPALLEQRATPPPRPVFHLGSREDKVVLFDRQEAAIVRAREIDGCAVKAEPWAEGCEIFRSEKGAPVVVFTHGGGHAFPRQAVPFIVRFFKEHALPPASH